MKIVFPVPWVPGRSAKVNRSTAEILLGPLVRSGLVILLLCICHFVCAQTENRVTQPDATPMRALPNYLPRWANAANDLGPVPPDRTLENITIVLSRSTEREAAFEKLLEDQQVPGSPDYHQWLTPAQIGERFGLGQQDITAVSDWLQSQNLHVNWISPSRIFIAFGGKAADIGRAFHTELHYYKFHGEQRMSVASDPSIPAALMEKVKAIRGLRDAEERPQHHAIRAGSALPAATWGPGANQVAPADFATIYDLPSGLTGAGETIGIVDEARTDFTDFANFRTLTGATFANPTEVVPTAFGGVDPGPAYTSPPSGGWPVIDDQFESTLDVTRAGSVAPAAGLLLVIASPSSGGIWAAAQYLVQTSPVPAQVMSISFGGCEGPDGQGAVDAWDALFQQAAGEGISVFVCSGDSGASGCDSYFETPPADPAPNSPNFICSSSYATCVGGTEFNDTSDYATYWASSNSPNLSSALSYIPEGGWNESWNGTSSDTAASGGGVSAFIATPTWQTGTGVPSARVGRYTPDIAFSSSAHDSYFMCMAADSFSCDSIYSSEGAWGTSAAAPDMAGITALLDQKLNGAQGNLNPELYRMAATTPPVFHDVTVATSGVTDCSVQIPSMCNNSIAGPTTLTGGQAGYLVTDGFDEVTGLGSLDVQIFIDNYPKLPTAPLITSANATTFTSGMAGSFTVTSTGNPVPTFHEEGSLPSGVTFTDSGNGTATLGGTPTLTGTFPLQITANNGVSPNATQRFNLTVDSAGAELTSPRPGSQFASSGVTFNWSAGNGVTAYWFNLGTATSGANAKNIYSSGSVKVLTETVTGLPTNGETLYATLSSYINAVWQPTVYTFYATGPAVLITPSPTTKLTASTTFTWSPGTGITHYWFNLGTSAVPAYAKNIYSGSSTTSTSVTVSEIPQYGETLYATLYSYVSGAWQPIVYTFTAAGSPAAATLTTPAPASKLTSSSVTFTWSGGEGVTYYWFNLGTSPVPAVAKNIYSGSPTTATSVTVTGLPTNGETIYATLYSYIAGVWQPTVYTYTASGSPTSAALNTPAPSSTLTSSTVTFTWLPGSGVTYFWFNLGTGTSATAAKNIYSSGSTTATSVTVTGIPTNGETIYATLYSYIGGVWQPTVYTYTAQ